MTRISRRIAMAAAIGAVLGLGAISVRAASAKAEVTGTYKWTTERNGQSWETTLKLKQDGDKLTGTVSGRQGGNDTAIEDAKVNGDEVSFKVTREFNGNKMVQKFKAKVTGDSMKGTIEFERDGNTMTRDFEAKRS
ncbi:MAG: hypothetical protein U0800_19505 [Isosphaeraceae bacterium]